MRRGVLLYTIRQPLTSKLDLNRFDPICTVLNIELLQSNGSLRMCPPWHASGGVAPRISRPGPTLLRRQS